jgi:hypothetical protein
VTPLRVSDPDYIALRTAVRAYNSVAEKCLNERAPYICVQSGVNLTSAFLLSLPGHGHADREAHGLQDDAPVPPQNSYP